MKVLLNKLFIESFSFFNDKDFNIEDCLKVADLLLLNIAVDYQNSSDFSSYLDNFKELNKLLSIYFKENAEGEEVKVFDNNNIELCKKLETIKKSAALTKFKNQRLAFYNRVDNNLVKVVNNYKSNSKAA